MKPSSVILYVLVSLSTVFSLTALILVAGNNISTPNGHYSNPSITNTPESKILITPVPTKNASSWITFNYTQLSSRNSDNTYTYSSQTTVVLNVIVECHGESEVTLKYSRFYLELSVGRLGYMFSTSEKVYPQNTGSITLGPSHPTENIRLTFQFPTFTNNGMDMAGTGYTLKMGNFPPLQ